MLKRTGPLNLRVFSETGVCFYLLAVSAALTLFPVLFLGKLPINSESLDRLPPWQASLPEDTGLPGYLQPDLDPARHYAAYRFLSEATDEDNSILWNPRERAGVPFLAQWWTRSLSPFSIPFYFFHLEAALAASALLKVLTAGCVAFYVARALGLSQGFALMVSVSVQAGAHLMLWIDDPISDVYPWLPLLFLYAERISLGQARYWPVGAAALGLMLLGGDPAAVIAALLFVAAYSSARIAVHNERGLTRLRMASAGGGLALALALAAVQLLPWIQWRLNTTAAASPTELSPALVHAATLLLPLSSPEVSPVESGRVLGALHIGMVQILLACLWMSLRGFTAIAHRRRIDAILGVAGGFILIVLLFSSTFRLLPGPDALGPQHWLIFCPFAFGLAGAATGEAWLQLRPAQCAVVLRRFAALLVVVLVTFIAAMALGGYAQLTAAPGFAWQVAGLVLPFLFFLGIIGVTLVRPHRRIMGYALAALAVMQALLIFSPMRSLPAAYAFAPRTEFIAELESVAGRVAGSAALKNWPLTVNGITDFYGTAPRMTKRHGTWVARLDEDPALIRRTGPAALLLTREDLSGPYARLRPSLHVRKVFAASTVLFDCLNCEDRVRMIHKGRTTDHCNPEDLSSALPPLVEAEVNFGDPFEGEGRPVVLSPDFNTRITINVEHSEPGVLVLTEAYFPGWTASIDGRRARVFPVDGLFRGVEVPPGAREVIFRYDPWTFRVGRVISILALLAVLGGFANLIYFRIHNYAYHP